MLFVSNSPADALHEHGSKKSMAASLYSRGTLLSRNDKWVSFIDLSDVVMHDIGRPTWQKEKKKNSIPNTFKTFGVSHFFFFFFFL